MKTLIRNVFIYTYILFVLPKVIPGVHIDGGFVTFLIGGVALTLLFSILRPILNLVSLPVNFISLGLFSLVVNAFLLYILTIFVTDIQIVKFEYPRTEAFGFVMPKISFNTFFAYVYTAFMLLLLDKFIQWLRK
jgi:putative membrane protein